MRLTQPKKSVFWLSVVLVGLGFLGTLVSIPFISSFSFWLVLVGYVLLALGVALKGF